jgi:flavin reductase (DIM6/NTAB) family NADH-FMN oxidoreductase RutF
MGTVTTQGGSTDTLGLRRALGHFATGVTVVSYAESGEFRGTTVNSFTSVSLEPPLVLVSLGRQTRAAAALRPGRTFAVNVLHHGQRELAMRFAGGPDTPVDWEVRAEVPHLTGCAAYFRCAARDVHGAGDHLLVVARVDDFQAHGHAPLIFHRGAFKHLASNDQHHEKESL